MADGLEEREEQQLDDDVGGDWPGKEGEVGHHGGQFTSAGSGKTERP